MVAQSTISAADRASRGLRFVRDDRNLRPDDAVEECRLAGVGPADERDVAGLHAVITALMIIYRDPVGALERTPCR